MICPSNIHPWTFVLKLCCRNLDFSISSEAKCSFDSKIDQNMSNMLYLMHICNFWSVQWFMNRFSLSILSKVQFSRQNAAGAGGAGNAEASIDFGRSGGSDYAVQITTCPPTRVELNLRFQFCVHTITYPEIYFESKICSEAYFKHYWNIKNCSKLWSEEFKARKTANLTSFRRTVPPPPWIFRPSYGRVQ